MSAVPAGSVSQLLRAWGRGDAQARDDLVPLVYQELRRRASAYLRRERPDHTLQPTALVHEAYIRLMAQRRVSWVNRAQFFALAAQLMRRILVDHARERQAAKRPGGIRVTFDETVRAVPAPDCEVLIPVGKTQRSDRKWNRSWPRMPTQKGSPKLQRSPRSLTSQPMRAQPRQHWHPGSNSGHTGS